MSPPRVLRTGIGDLDEFLGGSLPRNVILDVYGPGGSGKSQLLMQAAVEAAAAGFRVAFVDTTGGFRPERMLQMHPQHSILDHIGVLRATCTAEQIAMQAMLDDVDLLLVDNVTDLFMYEYSEEDAAPIRTHMFGAYMRSLARLAVTSDVSIIVSNGMRYTGNGEAESMQYVIDLYTHAKIWLSGKPRHTAECKTWNTAKKFHYQIHKDGIKFGQDGTDADGEMNPHT